MSRYWKEKKQCLRLVKFIAILLLLYLYGTAWVRKLHGHAHTVILSSLELMCLQAALLYRVDWQVCVSRGFMPVIPCRLDHACMLYIWCFWFTEASGIPESFYRKTNL